MHKTFLRIAAVLGAVSVAAGAFGAHGLRGVVSERALETFETAVRYQFYHVFALLATGVLYNYYPNKLLIYSAYFFVIGIVLFSGSLYALTYFIATVTPGFNWIGILTPFGGVALIAGWLLLFSAIKGEKNF